MRDALYRNNGNGTFTDVTEAAGVGDLGYSLGVTAGDYDNDGDQDLYLNNFGPDVLYRNNGDGTFEDVTEQAGVGNGDKVGAGVCFLDIEADGDLDLYVANYVNFTYENHVPIMVGQHRFRAGPRYYQPVPDTLFRNNGDGTFTDVSGPSGIGSVAGPSMGMVCGDFDDDGDTDVFVCNDEAANFLFQNDGRGKRGGRISFFKTMAEEISRRRGCWPGWPTISSAKQTPAWASIAATMTTTVNSICS